MIRAMVKNGLIQPLEPLPAGWLDGHEVVVNEPREHDRNGAERSDHWAEDMNALTADLDDPEEWQHIEDALTDADRLSKAVVRREMGLP